MDHAGGTGSEIVPMGGASPFDHLRHVDPDGREYWSARELCIPMGYDQWRRFEEAVDRARIACRNSGADTQSNFAGAGKVTQRVDGRSYSVHDWHLSRYAAYLVAMNSDPRKPEIARAQTYFAIKTREAEVASREMTKLEALRAAIESEEARLLAETRADDAERRTRELEPQAHAWEMLAAPGGDFSARRVAFFLNRDPAIFKGPYSIGQNNLLKLLRQFDMIDAKGIPYQKHVAHLRLKPRSRPDRDSGKRKKAPDQVRITYPGIVYLHHRLGGVASIHRIIAEGQASFDDLDGDDS